MRNFFSRAFVVAGLLAMAACGGGGGGDAFQTPAAPQQPGGQTPPPAAPAAASVSVVASTPTLPSNGGTPVEINAFVRDANNAFMANQAVVFTADSGGLQIVQATTDANGVAKANLTTAGDPTNRAIRVTATVGTVSGNVTVNVAGSQLTVQGPTGLVLGQTGNYTIALIDSGNNGVANRTVTLASARNNTLSATSVTTNSAGQATFSMTVANTGADTISATALGQTATLAVSVNNDAFSFVTPTANQEIQLGATQEVKVRWLNQGAPVVGQTVTFATTRGTLTGATAPTAVTNSAGEAVINLTAANAGGGVVSALGAGGASAQQSVEFVATTASTIDVQPTIFSLAPNEVSTLTAVVRDPAGNLVKNKDVTFSLQDVTGGTLSTPTARTDSQGRAQTAYTAGSVASARDGVVITASVVGSPSVTDQVMLTVAQRALSITLGTGNEIEEFSTSQYRIQYTVQVTDASGNGVAGVQLAMSVLSLEYFKGFRVAATAPATGWATSYTVPGPEGPGCANEDVNRNGVLDPGEDFNNSGRIEAGNIVTVSPGTGATDSNGFLTVYVYYPQEYAEYLTVALEARASVSGTEFVRTSNFLLPGSDSDFNSVNTAPPGPTSPFGTATTCSNPN